MNEFVTPMCEDNLTYVTFDVVDDGTVMTAERRGRLMFTYRWPHVLTDDQQVATFDMVNSILRQIAALP